VPVNLNRLFQIKAVVPSGRLTSGSPYGFGTSHLPQPIRALRANIDETVLLVVITEQGENRNQCEEQWNLFGFLDGFTRRGT
jgi:hypothetical protein